MTEGADPARSEFRPATNLELLGALGPSFLLRSVLIALAVAAVIGLPTDVIPNPWFTRMTPVAPYDYAFLVLSSLLTGAVFATGSSFDRQNGTRFGATGGVLGWLAIGCPTCNKLIVGLLGFSGAVTYFGPVQPILGALSVGLGALALVLRFRALRGRCIPVAGPAGRCELASEPAV